jgi:nucleoside-diphosphate-sugar epimerase
LRSPTVIAAGGFVFLTPILEASQGPCLRPMGFDPMCPLISDKDLVRASILALHAKESGIFNVTGRETLPLSVLAEWTSRGELVLPGVFFAAASRVLQLSRGERARAAIAGPQLRYGFTLDATRAERVLGFRPSYRIGRARDGDGRLRLETPRI